MNRLISILFFLLVSSVAVGQTAEQRYLVFTFNRTYQIQGYKHGTGDHVWIIPVDSCKDGDFEKKMKPLFFDASNLECLEDSIISNQSFGEFPIANYPKSDTIAWNLFKNRRLIQTRTLKYNYPKSTDILTIYCVPIIARCVLRPFGFDRNEIVTFDGSPTIWTDFWETTDKDMERVILHHDFSTFDFRISLSKPF